MKADGRMMFVLWLIVIVVARMSFKVKSIIFFDVSYGGDLL